MTQNNTVFIPTPLPHQRKPLDSPKRMKLWRWGRRCGKSRAMLRAAIMGHGPRVVRNIFGIYERDWTPSAPLRAGEYKSRLYKGIIEGARIAWVAKDYPQSREIWEEEIRARFANAVNCEVKEADKILRIHSTDSQGKHMRGQLEIRSAEAVDGMRGFKYDGVLVDEAAHIKLEYAWPRVLRPTLADTAGWAILASTTKIGSRFNTMCRDTEAGVRGPQWECVHLRTRDNTLLDKEEIDDLYADYPPGSSDLLEELEAELLDAHGDLFKAEYWHYYDHADHEGMVLGDKLLRFNEVVLYADLASSMKQRADFTSVMIVGYTAQIGRIPRKAGVLFVHNERLEGPDQLTLLERLILEHKVTSVELESVQYQLTAVQHMRRKMPRIKFKEVYPDTDKRSRAVPWAAAMARGDVFWPRVASWLNALITQYLKFPNGNENSELVEDHDDMVDTGSMAAVRLMRAKKTPVLPPSGSTSGME